MHEIWVVKSVMELHLAVSFSCYISRVPFDIEFYEIDTALYYQNFPLRTHVISIIANITGILYTLKHSLRAITENFKAEISFAAHSV